MHKFIFLLSAILLVSCGKQTQSSNGSSKQEREETDENYLEVDAHESSDLLNVTADIPIEIEGDRIIFKSSRQLKDVGSRISCGLTINSGDIYAFDLAGGRLYLTLPDGERISMKRVIPGEGPMGSWISVHRKGHSKVTRRYSITEDRMLLNVDCEG